MYITLNETISSYCIFYRMSNYFKCIFYLLLDSFNGREGLVLYNLNYNDNGTVRPLFYRMSLAEMFIPYG